MTSLLGPLLNISPAIPAIAIFGILGIATLDSFNWQGRGGTLLLDWLASFSAEHRARVIRHEAGHFLVAQLLDIPVTGYTLTAWEALREGHPGVGGVQFATEELESELATGRLSGQLVDRYCTVWMAGIAAEQLAYSNAEGGSDDRQKMRLLWTQLKRSPSEGEIKERWALLQAKSMIQTHQAAYDALVSKLEQRAPVDECQQAIAAQSAA